MAETRGFCLAECGRPSGHPHEGQMSGVWSFESDAEHSHRPQSVGAAIPLDSARRAYRSLLMQAGARGVAQRLAKVEAENASLRTDLAACVGRLDEVAALLKGEAEDYDARELRLREFADQCPAPPDADTTDPWEIARRAGSGLSEAEILELYGDE